jgi:hypothetical protein
VPLVKDLARFETIKYDTAPFKQQVHNSYSLPHTFHLISSHRSATWAASRAGSPLSVSLDMTRVLSIL